MKYSDYDVISVLSVSELKDEMQKKLNRDGVLTVIILSAEVILFR